MAPVLRVRHTKDKKKAYETHAFLLVLIQDS